MKLFRSMLRSTHCIHQLLPPLKFIKKRNSELLIVFLFSPIAIITFTNIHLFYDVYLMEHTNCLCLLLLLLFTGIVCSISFHFNFSSFQHCHIHCMLFSVLLDGVWLSRIKRITYLLTYLLKYVVVALLSEWCYWRIAATRRRHRSISARCIY